MANASIKVIEITQANWTSAITALPGTPLTANAMYLVYDTAAAPAGSPAASGTTATGAQGWLTDTTGLKYTPLSLSPAQVGAIVTAAVARFISDPVVSVNATTYVLSDADSGKVIELTGVCTITVPTTLTSAFRRVTIVPLDASVSTIQMASGTFNTDASPATGVASVTTAAQRGAQYQPERFSDGTIFIHLGA